MRRGDDTETQTVEGNVTTKAEIAVMMPQAQGHPEPPEAGIGMKASSRRDSRGSMAPSTPRF